jgi:hypothetical protein
MKTYLCDKIERANYSDIKSIADGIITFYPGFGFETIEETSQSVYTEEMQDTIAGPLITQKLAVNAEMGYIAANNFNVQPQIFRLTFSKTPNIPFIWGSMNNPVTCNNDQRESDTTKIAFIRKTNFHEV